MNNTEVIEVKSEPKQTPKQHRKWCTNCADWKVFTKAEEIYTCNDCSKISDATLADVPQEKIEEQQNRFKNQRREDFANMLKAYRFMQENPGQKYEHDFLDQILEDDAGVLEVEKLEREKHEAQVQAIKEDIAKHKHLGRNDKCSCNSGLKYKKCCLKRIESYR